MKKFVSIFICLVVISGFSVCAYEYPSAFWGVNSKYETALNANDYAKIVEYGNQIINIMQSAPDGLEKQTILATRYKQVGLSYAQLGDYDNAVKTYRILSDYAGRLGADFESYKKEADACLLQYASEIKMYTSGGKTAYYGAVNEHYNGVLFGMCATGETRSKLDNESMVLTYQELGQTLLAYNVGVLRDAKKYGLAVEFALNCPKQGTDIKNINKMDSYLKEISNLFKEYPDIPIYLRFAAEFDIWTNPAEPEEFKYAFRYVSNYFKQRHSNVAIVWSPNYVSSWDIDIDDYYPGDNYVDWVGMSLYAQKYFLGDPNQKEANEIIYKTGMFSEPVIAVKEIVEKYGDRKPIMLSESGCGHRIVKRGESTTDFALQRLKEMYSYLPMVYPQIKLIAYFDWYVEADTEKNDFRLSSNTALQNEYLKLIKGERFIQDGYKSETDFCYREIYNGASVGNIFPISCYAHLYKSNISKVTYLIDDKYAGVSYEIPFTTMIDASAYSGRHQLKAVATFDNGKTLTTSSYINITNGGGDIEVEIDGDEVIFDQNPVIYNSRTMVPMRKIFEELGASVTWDASTQTVTGKKGDRTVKLTIGSQKMYINKKEVALDTAPFILSGRTLVPARAVAEGLGCDVKWDAVSRVVSIIPKVFKWSEWSKSLPSYVDDDLYYIEQKREYRYSIREKETFTLDYKTNRYRLIDTETYYGSWGNWTENYISSSSELEVQTRTQSTPKRYFYAHYCTGNEKDESIRYRTSDVEFSEKCSYHVLGWYDNPLPEANDGGRGYILYKSNGDKYRCSNTCFRWFVLDTTGGDYTEYRSRPIYKEYTYWKWGDWSNWSNWSEEDPEDEYDTWYNTNIDLDVEERTVYRYKEK